jgi:6,7-dimethyl-8-ribityllumazine synthase
LKTEYIRKKVSAAGFRFAIVVSRWNEKLTSKLADGAVEALYEAGADPESIEIFHVPGSFELPTACLKAADTGNFSAVIALGVVIRGETPHFDYVAGQAASGVMQASIKTGVPVLFGVITANTLDQAMMRAGERVDNKGFEAALAAIEMANLFREIESGSKQGGGDTKVLPHVV